MHAVAPRATALTMSLPRRTPPSQMISTRPPTASATGATRSRAAGASSSCRPPWFDRATASTPTSAAILASSTVWIPLITIGPFQTERNQSTSSHDSRASNCVAKVSARLTADDPSGWSVAADEEAMLAKRIGSARTNRQVHDGCTAPSRIVPRPSFGGSSNPRLTSRSRRPRLAVSTVITSAS